MFCGDHTLKSAEGVQQGDPLGPLLFCITIQQLIVDLRADFKVFYLDDGILGGSLGDVLTDIQQIEESAAELDLQLNFNKCELICDSESIVCDMLSVAPHVQVVSRSQASLLGAPIGDIISIDTCILDKITKLEIMGERLSLLSSHDSLLLLRHSLCIQKILYILRTAPCFISDKLHTFENSLRSILSDILTVLGCRLPCL